MIIDSPGILQLAVGTDKRIPEVGDNQIVLPATILPVITPTQIIRAAQSSTEIQRTSFVASTSDTRTNQAANVLTLCTVEKGLWDFVFTLTTRANYISAALVNGADLSWNNGLFSIQLINVLPVGTATVPDSKVTILPIRMLLGEQITFELRTGLTGVGATMESQLRVIANRIL